MKQNTEKPASLPGQVKPIVRLCSAIKEAIEEMERCPYDSIQDIWNEKLEEWQTGLRMDHYHNIEPNSNITSA